MDRKNIGWCAWLVALLTTIGGVAPAAADVPWVQRPQWEQKIEAVLDQPTSFEFIDTPLTDAVRFLQDRHQLPIHIDRHALDDNGIAVDTPVSLVLRDVPLRTALRWMLKPIDLTYLLENESLIVSTRYAADEALVQRVYRVGALIDEGPDAAWQLDELLQLITSVVAPTAWHDVGGPAPISAVPRSRSLVIAQSQEVHREIERLLDALLTARQALAAGTAHQLPASFPAPDSRAAMFSEQLQKPVSLELHDTPLADALELLAEKTGVAVVMDRRALEDEGIGMDTEVSLSVRDLTLRSALALMLKPLDLAYYEDDGLLVVTTKTEMEYRLAMRVYPASELLGGADDVPLVKRVTRGMTGDRLTELVATLTDSVAPMAWADAGGPFGIDGYQASGAIVVVADPGVHRQLDALLGELRAQVPAGGDKPAAKTPAAVVIRIYELCQPGAVHNASRELGAGFFQVAAATDDQPPPAQACPGGQCAATGQTAIPPELDMAQIAQQLAAAIPRLVEPDKWDRTGGPGSIHAIGRDLVVRQTEDVQRQVVDLLVQLRLLD